MSTERPRLIRCAGRRLSILDPETLDEVGFIEVPENFTAAEAEKFRDHLIRLAKEGEHGSN